MQATAGRLLREGEGALQALDAQLQQEPVLVGERVMQVRIGLAGRRRHPVMAVVGKQRIPLVEALLVQQASLLHYESDEVLVGHAAVMSSRHARNWLRIDKSLVPLATISAFCF